MATLQVTFVSENAGFDNVLGWYNSRTGEAGIVFASTNDDGRHASVSAGDSATLEADQADIDAGYIGFFLIPNGANIYGGKKSPLDGPLTFQTDAQGDGQILDAKGHPLRGAQGELIFTDPGLNKRDADYTAGDDDGILGTIAFEDLVHKGDRDFNDLVIDVQIAPPPAPKVALEIEFVSESADFQNTLGWYNSRTGEAGIVFLNTDDDAQPPALTPGTIATLEVDQADLDAGNIGFFLVPDGASNYGTGADSALRGPLRFETKPNGDGVILDADGHKLRGEQNEIIFSDPSLNKHDRDYTVGDDDGDGILGTIAFEDLVRHSDRDFNDLVIQVRLAQTNEAPVVDDQAFSVKENSAAGTVVGTVVAEDPNAGDTLKFEIIGGSGQGVFSIDEDSGELQVLDGTQLDFEDPAQNAYTLVVRVTDAGGLSDDSTIDISVSNVVEVLAGHSVDGYVSGATVFGDANGNGVLDLGEVSATTDSAGNFTLVDSSGDLVMTGGTDVATGLAFTGSLRAPEGSTVVTPLSTLVSALTDDGQLVDAARGHVSTAFGIDPLQFDLLHFDPIPTVLGAGADAGAAAQLAAAGIQVQSAIVQVGALLGGAGAVDPHAAVVEALADLASTGATVDLSDPATAEALILAAAAIAGVDPLVIDAVIGDAAAVLAATSGSIADAAIGGGGAATLEALAKAAGVAQGPALAEALAQAGATNTSGSLLDEYTGDGLAYRIALADALDVDGGTLGTPGDDHLIGTPGTDILDGLGGNDVLDGLERGDLLIGGDGNDILNGGSGNDILRGGAGDDTLNGGIVADFQSDEGFRDFDRADYRDAPGPVNVNLATGVAQDGDGGTDQLSGIEAIDGSAFDDVLTGSSAFSEEFSGGGGDDLIDGGAGFDRALYRDASSGVAIDVGAFGGAPANASASVTGGGIGTDTLVNVEQFVGSDFDDTYTVGNFRSNSIPGGFFSNFNAFEGGAGNDVLAGNGNTRAEYTNATSGVIVNLATGTATGDASVGSDTFLGGVNQVRGSDFADVLTGGNPFSDGFESFHGRGGDDTIDGGSGFDKADYAFDGPVSTGIDVHLADGVVVGDAFYTGTDSLQGIEAIRGSHRDDFYDATGFGAFSTNAGSLGDFNEFEGLAGNDTIIGNGSTRVTYGFAREAVEVDLTAGTADGGASVGHDTILGGVNAVNGSNFDDELKGSSGNEQLFGGAGNDVLIGTAGFDSMNGFTGRDLADYSGLADPVYVDLLGNFVDKGPAGFDFIIDVEDVVGTSGDDTLLGNFGNNHLVGGLGNDLLRGGGGNDVLDGGDIADFQSDAGFRDDDRADYSTAFTGVVVNLADGTAIDGEGGIDELNGIEGVIGSANDDFFQGSDAFREVYRGGAGNDTIQGAGGFDIAEYSNATASVFIELGSFMFPDVNSSARVFGDASVGEDSLSDVEQFVGSEFDDVYSVGGFSSGALPGGVSTSFNTFEGRGGNDQIFGNGNTRADYTNATGSVTVDLQGNFASGDASVGFDTLFGVNQARGSSYDDVLLGDFAGNTLDGRGGNDFIDGRGGFDRADYAFNGPSLSGISVNLAAGTVFGDPVYTGNDTLRSIEAIRGTHLADTYDATNFGFVGPNFGSNGTLNEFEGMAGDDTVIGNGNTRLTFGLAREGVTVNLEAGTVVGGDSVGTDTVSGISAMRGSNFDDVLIGTNHGITSAQVYEGRAGDDRFEGRGGFDQARYDGDPTSTGISVVMAAINDFTGTVTGDAAIGVDTLVDIVSVVGTSFDDTYNAAGYFSGTSTLGAFNEFDGGAGNDTITGNGATRVSFLSAFTGVSVDLAAGTASGFASGNDMLINVFSVRGSNQDDVLRGSAFDDTFEGRGGNDFINGRDGFDLVRYDNGSSGGGTFIADAAGAFSASAGGHNTDRLVNIEAIRGTNFGDLFYAVASSAGYRFEGRGGDDIVFGSQGDDDLRGEDGNDLLVGGLGADVLRGGAGSDRFDFNSLAEAGDTLVDFQTGMFGDVIDIADLLLNETTYSGAFLTDFVRISAAGAAGILEIDTDGIFGPETWRMLAIINGGAALDVTTLVADGNLRVDAVAGILVIGTDGSDFLLGSPGNDEIHALLGNDFIVSSAGDDFIDGGIVADLQSVDGWRDTDRVDYSGAPGPVVVNLAVGIAVDGEGGIDTLSGIEAINGSNFNDTLTGGDAFLEIFHGGSGNDLIQGGGGNDRAEYQDATSGLFISIGAAGNSSGTVSGDASVGFDTVVDVEMFVGSDHPDTYLANAFQSASQPGGFLGGFNAFEGRGGNDFIVGNGSTRIEYTGASDAVEVNLATGTAQGRFGDAGIGFDNFSGVNSVRGSRFDDRLLGGGLASDGFESFDGRGGNDFIDGGSGFDRADYGFHGPVSIGITVNLAAGTVSGDPVLVGFDTLRGIESVRGTHLDDTFDATGFSGFSTNAGWFGETNEFEGMAGHDTIIGNGFTTIVFYSAREGVIVNLETGKVTGGASVGEDDILGGVFSVRGSNFADTLVGSIGSDVLVGGFGDDVLRGGAGSDFLEGGPGSDRFVFRSPFEGTDNIASFEFFPGGGDVLEIGDLLQDWTSYAGGAGGPLTDFVQIVPDMFGFGGELQIDVDGAAGPMIWQTLAFIGGGAGLNVADLLANGNLDTAPTPGGTGIVIRGTPANETLTGTPFDDDLNGDGGADTLIGLAGDDVLDGGETADLQSFEGFFFDRVNYSSSPSGVIVNLAAGTASDGWGGTDSLSHFESVVGSPFNDTIIGGDAFSEIYDGLGGDDFIDGGPGNDQVRYFDAISSLNITLGGVFTFDATGSVSGDAATGTDTLLNVERVAGSNAADTYTVQLFLSNSQPGGFASAFNSFEGRGGNDVINGNGATRIEFTGAFDAVEVNLGTGTAQGRFSDAGVGIDSFTGVNSIRASGFDDLLWGSAFDDSFDGRAGNDEIHGLGGFDRADYAFNGPSAVGLQIMLANGVVIGDPTFSGTDTLDSVEAVRGTHLADVYDATGFSGASANAGSLGSLNEFEGMAGDDTVIGNGNTRLSFGSAREGVKVDLLAGTVEGGPSVGNDTLMGGIVSVRGSNFNDEIRGTNNGTAFTEFYEGLGGNDTFDGRGGVDRALFGTAGVHGIEVHMATMEGTNIGTVTGDSAVGTDKLIDIAFVNGTFLADTYDATGYFSAVTGLGSFNEFDGGAGNDVITGNGSTRVSFQSLFDSVIVDLVAGTATGAISGNDTLFNIFAVRGSNTTDMLFGSLVDDTFEGRGGDDFIDGRDGFDLARYDFGSNSGGSFTATAANEFTASAGGLGMDHLVDVEAIRGTNFADTYNASAFIGLNEFEGLGGNDLVTGNGATRVSYANAGSGINADLGSNVITGASTGTDTLLGGVSLIRGSNFNDNLDASGSFFAYSLEGGRGNDTLLGSNGADTLMGGEGDDFIWGRGGADTIDAGPGSDRIDYNAMSEGGDAIFGFEAGPLGDIVDIANLIASGTNFDPGMHALSDYVRIRDLMDGNSALEIDTDGLGTDADWAGLATLIGFTGLSADDLLASGNLDIVV